MNPNAEQIWAARDLLQCGSLTLVDVDVDRLAQFIADREDALLARLAAETMRADTASRRLNDVQGDKHVVHDEKYHEHVDAWQERAHAEKTRADTLSAQVSRMDATARHIINVMKGTGGVESLGNSDVESAIRGFVLNAAEESRAAQSSIEAAEGWRKTAVDTQASLVESLIKLENAERLASETAARVLELERIANELVLAIKADATNFYNNQSAADMHLLSLIHI